jgi:4-amino-4-deoxy-L-arabinose transferase and related glycosyltransferases of PMT family
VIDYPPFFYASAFWFKTLFGAILPNAALYAGTVFLVILLASVYKIGSYWGKENGLLAAFICGMYPMIFWTSRHFSLELPLAAMTALSIRYLLKTDLFRSRKYAVVLGIVMGVGMLTKQTFGVYVCGPFTVVLVRMFREFRGPERNLRMGNAGLCLLLTLLISLIYYHEPEVFRNILVRSGFSGAVAEKSIFNPAHLFYYPWTLRNTIGVFLRRCCCGRLC